MTYLESAREALRLHRKGLSVSDIKTAIGERYAVDVRRKINVGTMEEDLAEPALSSEELSLILNIGRAERRALECGDTCSPKLKHCAGMFWPQGKAERIARKRLGTHRRGEDETAKGTGLRLLTPYHGGYVRLSRTGWALVHAIEAERAPS